MANYKITFPPKNVNGETIQSYLSINFNDGIPITQITSDSVNVSIADHGESDLDFSLTEALLTPADVTITINDRDEWLKNLLYNNINDNITLFYEYYINGTIEFSGNSKVGSKKYLNKKFTASFTVDTKKLYEATFIDSDDINLNPLNINIGATFNATYSIPYIIDKIFRYIDPNLNATIIQDWIFRTTFSGVNYDKTFTDIYITSQTWFANKNFANNLGDLLKKIAEFFCCQACLLSNNTAFFRKLFYYSSSNLQTLGTVKYHEITEPNPKINYCESYQSSIDRIWGKYGNFTEVEGLYKKIQVEGQSYALAIIGGQTKVLDLAKDPLFNEFDYYPSLPARYYYYWLSVYNRIDIFKVVGLTYRYEKNFNYSGGKYQILKMKKEIANGITEIHAIYLGKI